MANFITQSSIDALQAYYTEKSADIFEEVFLTPMYDADFNVSTAKDRELLISSTSTEMLQAYQPGWTPKGGVTLAAQALIMRPVKIDLEFYPRDYAFDTYDAKLRKSGNDPYDYPWTQYMTEKIMGRMYHDFIDKILWTGNYTAPTAGTAGNAAAAADGFETQIQDAITATTITEVATGAITAGSEVEEIRDFVKTVLNTFEKRQERWSLYCSLDLFDRYQENYEDTIGTALFSKDPYTLRGIDGANGVTIRPQAALTGDQMILTRTQNLALRFDGAPNLEFERAKRQVHIFGDWAVGLGIYRLDDIYRNDQ